MAGTRPRLMRWRRTSASCLTDRSAEIRAVVSARGLHYPAGIKKRGTLRCPVNISASSGGEGGEIQRRTYAGTDKTVRKNGVKAGGPHDVRHKALRLFVPQLIVRRLRKPEVSRLSLFSSLNGPQQVTECVEVVLPSKPVYGRKRKKRPWPLFFLPCRR